jgi:hypothetical protein
METETAGKIKYGILGLVCGGIIVMLIGFNWGGWTTSSTTKAMSEKAVVASKAAICVAQFIKDPNYKENLKAFEKLDSYGMKNTSDYVRKFGWDKMPGEKEADHDVAAACAQGIELIIKKGAK